LRPKGEPIRTGFEHPSFTFSNDGRQLIADGVVTGGQVRQVWDVDRRRPVGRPVEGDLGIAAFSVDDEAVVIETGIDQATIKSLRSGRRIARLAGTQDAEDVEFHPQSGQALVETLWGSGIWDARSGKRVSRIFPSTSAAWTPDGTVVATGGDSIELWDAKTSRRLGSLPSETGARDVRFSPDGTLLVGVGAGLEVWDVSRRSRLGGRRLGELGLAKVEFSPDGRAVATLDDEGQLLVWTLDGRKWASLACRLADRTLTRTESDELVGKADFASAC
jgi:WD40 repeat protein